MAGNMMTLLSFMIGTFSFLVLCQVQNSNAYPTGAVTSACGDMTPNHGPSSQTSVSPYTISVSPAFYQPGEQMTVTIFSNTGSLALKGMLLQARRTGTNEIIGTWSLAGTTGFQTLACNGANSAVTHTNNDDKPAAFQLNWTPPDVNGDDIYVTATFVQTMQVFWVAERTSDIQDACNANGANLCGANGNCESLIGSGINCICEEGYTGILCTMGPCDSDPCVNGGTCTNSAGDTPFTCSCPFPFGGPTCQTVQDLCTGNLCENGAGCTQAPGANPPYTCQCLTGFSGVFCGTGTTSNLCSDDPCQNGGTCNQRSDTAYTCTCPATYVGTNCDIPAPCNPSLCQNGGTCTVTGTESYSCACPSLYTGINCQTLADTTLPTITGCPGDITDTALPGENSLSVTWNEPQASDASGIKSFTSNIPSGFSFPTSQTTLVVYTAEDNAGNIHRCGFSVTVNAASELRGCLRVPCQNGGTCAFNEDGDPVCVCLVGYAGPQCESAIPCESSPCQNDGICFGSGSGAGYLCQCPTGYTGLNCETEICTASTCHNGGTCIDEITGFNCQCPEGYSGDRCNISVTTTTPCNPSPCQNGGTCNQRSDTAYTCACPTTHVGYNCDIPAPCNPRPCQNGGVCTVIGLESYSCACPPLYNGINCQTLGKHVL